MLTQCPRGKRTEKRDKRSTYEPFIDDNYVSLTLHGQNIHSPANPWRGSRGYSDQI